MEKILSGQRTAGRFLSEPQGLTLLSRQKAVNTFAHITINTATD
jgi:hypothetical protein